MTIKPVIAPAPKPTEKKESSHSGGQVVVVEQHSVLQQPSGHSQQNAARGAAAHSHRNVNVVIDGGHGQSPRRGEVFDELSRHRRSPHKSTRAKRRDHHHDHHHNKRDRVEREKLSSISSAASSKCGSPHVHNNVANVGVGVSNSSGSSSPANVGSKSPEQFSAIPAVLGCQSPKSAQNAVAQAAAKFHKGVEETYSGYNSGDEHLQPKEAAITADEWQQRDEKFAKCMEERGYVLKPVEEDGACLFRSISLQIYGDEEMHDVIRQHTMDYIFKNREYYGHFVTEDINSYIKRKRRKDSHGNHIEIQAMSEIYSRPVEVYCYKATPINIFNSEQVNNAPLRLSYQRGSHYNAIIDPYNATVGVGLGLAGYKPELQTKEAARLSEQLEIEQTMFEDKLKTTDWEATNEAIEEQIARESYLQWCRENLHKSRALGPSGAAAAASSSATVTSAEAASDAEASPSKYSVQRNTAVGFSSSATNVCVSPGLGASSTASGSGMSKLSPASSGSFVALELSKLGHHNVKKDEAASCDMGGGFDSDDTDMSSTSSMGNSGGNASPSSLAKKTRVKKIKTRANAVHGSGSKKRRREQNATSMGTSELAKDADVAAATRKNAKSPLATAVPKTRSRTPEAEQQPCTSKQSNTPEKLSADGVGVQQNDSSAVVASSSKQSLSCFYRELLEASYASEGQLTESEMLQRAIQMSTHDYIEDQKRKYFYGP